MFDNIGTTFRHLPDILMQRLQDGHWPVVLAGAIVIIYVLAALVAGSIWATGNIDRAEQAGSFWGAVIAYVIVGSALAFYV